LADAREFQEFKKGLLRIPEVEEGFTTCEIQRGLPTRAQDGILPHFR
jgi:hypothetical protein